MKQISKFFTLYWCIYFPTCIAYNDSISWFSSIDEIMTGVIILFTFMKKGNRNLNKTPWKEYYYFFVIIGSYLIYSLLFGRNVMGGILLDFIQEIRPYSIIFCTWILNPQFTRKQKRIMLFVMIITLFSWIYYHPATSYVDKEGNVIEPEFPVLGQLAICTGMTWYLFTNPSQRNKYIAFALVLTGMIAPKFKFLGEIVCFIYMIFILRHRFNFKSSRTALSIAIMIFVVIFVTWSRFDAYFVSGASEDWMARPLSYKTAFGKIIWDYFPFGPGMGTFACNGAWRYYSPLYYEYGLNNIWGLNEGGGFICDAYYPTLAQFGIVGIFFFIAFWKRRLIDFSKIEDLQYYRIAFITFFCLAIEQSADSSFLSGKGMGYCMLLGLCLNANHNKIKEKREIQKKKSLGNEVVNETTQNDHLHLREDYPLYHPNYGKQL